MREFLKELKQCKWKLPMNTYRTLKGQALSGDLEGAKKGLERIKTLYRGGVHHANRDWNIETR